MSDRQFDIRDISIIFRNAAAELTTRYQGRRPFPDERKYAMPWLNHADAIMNLYQEIDSVPKKHFLTEEQKTEVEAFRKHLVNLFGYEIKSGSGNLGVANAIGKRFSQDSETLRIEFERLEMEAASLESWLPQLESSVTSTNARLAVQSSISNSKYIFRKIGDTWQVAFDFEHASGLKNSKGLTHIAALFKTPTTTVPALDLLGRPECLALTDEVEQLEMSHWSSNNPKLDAKAKRSYKKRLEDIELEMAEAKKNHDQIGLERLQEEKQSLIDELKASIGLGGRDRQLGGPTPEVRAAKTVSKAIERAKHALRQKGMGKLADHIRDSIQLVGTGFVYNPSILPDWDF